MSQSSKTADESEFPRYETFMIAVRDFRDRKGLSKTNEPSNVEFGKYDNYKSEEKSNVIILLFFFLTNVENVPVFYSILSVMNLSASISLIYQFVDRCNICND